MFLPRKGDRGILLMALVLAVTTYAYLSDAIRKDSAEGRDPSYRLLKLTATSVPVKVRLASNPPEGYRLLQERVNVDPKRIVVIGPEALLEKTTSAETSIIDIGQSTKKIERDIPLESVAGVHLSGEPQTVKVEIPIEKLEPHP